MPHTPHVSVAARKPVPSGIGSLDDGSRAVGDARGLAQDSPDSTSAAVGARASAGAPAARNDSAPRVVEGPRTVAGRAQQELVFERAAAQLRPSWASEPPAGPSAMRNPPATGGVQPLTDQGEAESALTAEAPGVPVSPLANIEPELVTPERVTPEPVMRYAVTPPAAPPASFAPIDFAAIATSRAPLVDDTQALRAALEAPKRKTRMIALTGAACLVLGALIALFAGGDSSDARQTESGSASRVRVNAASQVPTQEPAAKQHAAQSPTNPSQHAVAPKVPERALEPSPAALAPAKALPVKTAGRAALPTAKPAPTKPPLTVAKPAPAKPAVLVAKPASPKASPLAAKPASAKAALLPAKPAPGKQATKPASLAAKAAPAKPASLAAKPRKGAPVTTAPAASPSKSGRSNPVDVLNPWAN